jgi:hypothetical protein
MKKSEFMKQENVPQFIKDLIENIPDDAVVNLGSLHIGSKPKEGGCKCDTCDEVYKDGVMVAPIIDNLVSSMETLLDLTDCQGNIRKDDTDRVKAVAFAIQGSATAMLLLTGGVPK